MYVYRILLDVGKPTAKFMNHDQTLSNFNSLKLINTYVSYSLFLTNLGYVSMSIFNTFFFY